jgi:flagellar L-ring protein precursor FlgH
MKYRFEKMLVLTFVFNVLAVSGIIAQESIIGGKIIKGGLIADVRAKGIGDVVTILINENTQASNSNNTQTNKQNTLDGEASFGNNFLRGLSGSISSQSSNQFQGSGQVSTQGLFTAQITAIIVGVKEDGNFLIRGSREVETNGEKVVTVVEGIVRPEDISRNNTISSTLIADAKIFHQGSGIVTQAHRPGLFTRVVNWIF